MRRAHAVLRIRFCIKAQKPRAVEALSWSRKRLTEEPGLSSGQWMQIHITLMKSQTRIRIESKGRIRIRIQSARSAPDTHKSQKSGLDTHRSEK